MFFWGKIVSYLVYLGQGKDLKLTTELFEKVQCPLNQAIKNKLNEAILFIWRDGFHSDIIKSKSQNSGASRILIYTGLKINKK